MVAGTVRTHAAAPGLQDFCQFSCKGATGRLLTVLAAAPFAVRALLDTVGIVGCGVCGLGSAAGLFAFGRLRRVGAEEPVFQRSAVEPANDGLHLVGGGRFNKSEALGLLSFVVADHLNRIGYEVFGGEPLFDVISGDPGRQIAKKYGEAHSVDLYTPLVGFWALQGGGFRSPQQWYQSAVCYCKGLI